MKSELNKEGLFLNAAKELTQETIFWTHQDNPFRANIEPGDPRIVLVVGDNASGKSFFVDNVRRIAKDISEDVSTVSISIRERTGSGLDDMAGLRRSMMFGNESEQSTGATSAGMIKKGFSNVLSRLEEGKKVILVLDEPELGLAETFHRAVGELIAQEVKALHSESEFSVLVVSHSRKLADGLFDGLDANPTTVTMGNHGDFEQWRLQSEDKTLEELLSLPQQGRENFRKVSGVFDSIRGIRKQQKSPGM